jgi:hypothetical protein
VLWGRAERGRGNGPAEAAQTRAGAGEGASELRVLLLAAFCLLSSKSFLESSLLLRSSSLLLCSSSSALRFSSAVSFCTEEIRCSIGKSQELAALFALLFNLNSLLAIESHHRDR